MFRTEPIENRYPLLPKSVCIGQCNIVSLGRLYNLGCILVEDLLKMSASFCNFVSTNNDTVELGLSFLSVSCPIISFEAGRSGLDWVRLFYAFGIIDSTAVICY